MSFNSISGLIMELVPYYFFYIFHTFREDFLSYLSFRLYCKIRLLHNIVKCKVFIYFLYLSLTLSVYLSAQFRFCMRHRLGCLWKPNSWENSTFKNAMIPYFTNFNFPLLFSFQVRSKMLLNLYTDVYMDGKYRHYPNNYQG